MKIDNYYQQTIETVWISVRYSEVRRYFRDKEVAYMAVYKGRIMRSLGAQLAIIASLIILASR